MPIEQTEDGTIIATGDGVTAYMLLSIRSTLALEIRTGLKFSNRVNVFKQAKTVLLANGIKPKGTKVAVWHQFNDLLVGAGMPEAQRKP